MGFARFFPQKDTWITNATENNIPLTASNYGSDPVLTVFSRKDEIVSGSIELSRILIKFPITELSGKIFNDLTIPSSSVTYKLKMFNMRHGNTVPTSYDLHAYPITRDWDEGTGTALPNLDFGFASWLSASSVQTWTTAGSDFTASMSASQHFDRGSEDFEIDVTRIVNEWLTGTTVSSNGFLIKFGTTEEANSTNYFLKAFHGRESKFIEKLPFLEARWDSTGIKDNRKNFAFNQQNKLYMYNFIRGELTNVSEPVLVKVTDSVVSRRRKVFSNIYSFIGRNWYL